VVAVPLGIVMACGRRQGGDGSFVSLLRRCLDHLDSADHAVARHREAQKTVIVFMGLDLHLLSTWRAPSASTRC